MSGGVMKLPRVQRSVMESSAESSCSPPSPRPLPRPRGRGINCSCRARGGEGLTVVAVPAGERGWAVNHKQTLQRSRRARGGEGLTVVAVPAGERGWAVNHKQTLQRSRRARGGEGVAVPAAPVLPRRHGGEKRTCPYSVGSPWDESHEYKKHTRDRARRTASRPVAHGHSAAGNAARCTGGAAREGAAFPAGPRYRSELIDTKRKRRGGLSHLQGNDMAPRSSGNSITQRERPGTASAGHSARR
jgi:hypothetical protein